MTDVRMNKRIWYEIEEYVKGLRDRVEEWGNGIHNEGIDECIEE